MPRLRKFGFFQELKYGDIDGGSLNSLISDTSSEEEEKIINYLKNGLCMIAASFLEKDILNPSEVIIGVPDILTDGVWAWPRTLAYYVKRYHVVLSSDFVAHMLQNRWTVPDEKSLNQNELEI